MTFVCTTMAYIVSGFPGWRLLTQTSPDILIARCATTPEPYNRKMNGISIDPDGLIESDIEVMTIMKGITNWGTASLKAPSLGRGHLSSQYWPRQDEYYLIFSIFYDGKYQAIENYRVVPLGLLFPTNCLSGKNLDDQIQLLLHRRLDNLNRQMKEEQEEKQRLEEGLKK